MGLATARESARQTTKGNEVDALPALCHQGRPSTNCSALPPPPIPSHPAPPPPSLLRRPPRCVLKPAAPRFVRGDARARGPFTTSSTLQEARVIKRVRKKRQRVGKRGGQSHPGRTRRRLCQGVRRWTDLLLALRNSLDSILALHFSKGADENQRLQFVAGSSHPPPSPPALGDVDI